MPSHRPPDPSVANYPLVTYVTDGIISAMAQAKAAAGDRHVLVHGAYTARRALEAGVLDGDLGDFPVRRSSSWPRIRRRQAVRAASRRHGRLAACERQT